MSIKTKTIRPCGSTYIRVNLDTMTVDINFMDGGTIRTLESYRDAIDTAIDLLREQERKNAKKKEAEKKQKK
jgi:hypothetical protein